MFLLLFRGGFRQAQHGLGKALVRQRQHTGPHAAGLAQRLHTGADPQGGDPCPVPLIAQIFYRFFRNVPRGQQQGRLAGPGGANRRVEPRLYLPSPSGQAQQGQQLIFHPNRPLSGEEGPPPANR